MKGKKVALQAQEMARLRAAGAYPLLLGGKAGRAAGGQPPLLWLPGVASAAAASAAAAVAAVGGGAVGGGSGAGDGGGGGTGGVTAEAASSGGDRSACVLGGEDVGGDGGAAAAAAVRAGLASQGRNPASPSLTAAAQPPPCSPPSAPFWKQAGGSGGGGHAGNAQAMAASTTRTEQWLARQAGGCEGPLGPPGHPFTCPAAPPYRPPTAPSGRGSILSPFAACAGPPAPPPHSFHPPLRRLSHTAGPPPTPPFSSPRPGPPPEASPPHLLSPRVDPRPPFPLALRPGGPGHPPSPHQPAAQLLNGKEAAPPHDLMGQGAGQLPVPLQAWGWPQPPQPPPQQQQVWGVGCVPALGSFHAAALPGAAPPGMPGVLPSCYPAPTSFLLPTGCAGTLGFSGWVPALHPCATVHAGPGAARQEAVMAVGPGPGTLMAAGPHLTALAPYPCMPITMPAGLHVSWGANFGIQGHCTPALPHPYSTPTSTGLQQQPCQPTWQP
ncbi:hypothetical protein V8C86DRAFT_1080742 [Haematococcus lacustris]